MFRVASIALAATSLASLAAGADECNATVVDPIITTIDNSTYFNTCALEEEDVAFNVTSLFDVLNFTSSDFILFCNSSTCLEPVHAMLHSIPTDCLINYDGSDRNLSEEVKSLHIKCHEALGEDEDDDGDDDDDMSGMDMSGMGMSGMDMGSTAGASSNNSAGLASGAARPMAVSALAMTLAATTVSVSLVL